MFTTEYSKEDSIQIRIFVKSLKTDFTLIHPLGATGRKMWIYFVNLYIGEFHQKIYTERPYFHGQWSNSIY